MRFNPRARIDQSQIQTRSGGTGGSGSGDSATPNTCESGTDANKSDACAIDLFTTSVQNYWKQAYPEEMGDPGCDTFATDEL